MTILKKIMELLKDRELTSIEIASEINIPKDNCASYLNTLYNDGRIKSKKDKRPYKYKIVETPKALLKQLYDFMSSKCNIVGEISEKQVDLLETIKGVVN
ncbi:hypothetical protein LCGC14_0668010 [marine sediment metagenome]|uniref:Transcription regulator TrmB N-terminal domain-containing protein n=1 Tax=marine sediment metagenome TaxID=412755 RepID=A0A0F9QRR8_9ZZZZ